MSSEPSILKAFPGTRYFPNVRLVTWHPEGILDDHLADRLVEFLEHEETIAVEPFHRFADLSGFEDIRLKVDDTFDLAYRRRTGYEGPEVKSAIFSDTSVGFGMARMYETLMQGGAIKVCAFRERDKAAAWLGVPLKILLPPFNSGEAGADVV